MSNIIGSRVKKLQVSIRKSQNEIDFLSNERDCLDKQISLKRKQLKSYELEIQKIQDKSKKIVVSEHALIRYLERVYNLDLKKLEDEILTEQIVNYIKTYGSGTYTNDCFQVKVVDNVVVTVISNDE